MRQISFLKTNSTTMTEEMVIIYMQYSRYDDSLYPHCPYILVCYQSLPMIISSP